MGSVEFRPLVETAALQARGEQDPASLARLQDLVVPPAVSAWPSTPGWIALAAALLALACGTAWLLLLRRRARTYRREALAELGGLADGVRSAVPDERASALRALPALLKRTALATYPRHQVAALSGEAWLAFLARESGDPRWQADPGHRLARLPYELDAAAGASEGEAVELLELTRAWILRHAGGDAERGGQAP